MSGRLAHPASAADAVARAADLLRDARRALVVCGATDLAGAFAAVGLAERLKAALDVAHGFDLRPFQERGILATVPGEARLRADALLLVGEIPAGGKGRTRLDHVLAAESEGAPAGGARQVVAVSAGSSVPPGGANDLGLDGPPAAALATLGLLRARLAGRPVATEGETLAAVDAVLARLRGAAYGVALFNPARLDPLAADSLFGLVDELSAATRWTVLPLSAPAGHAEIGRATLALAGMPPPLAFSSDGGMHDPWRFAGQRMVESGEADVVLWIEAGEAPPPAWVAAAPRLVALTSDPTAPAHAIRIPVGRPGRDVPGVVEDPRSGALRAIGQGRGGAIPSLAVRLGRLEAAIFPQAEAAA